MNCAAGFSATTGGRAVIGGATFTGIGAVFTAGSGFTSAFFAGCATTGFWAGVARFAATGLAAGFATLDFTAGFAFTTDFRFAGPDAARVFAAEVFAGFFALTALPLLPFAGFFDIVGAFRCCPLPQP